MKRESEGGEALALFVVCACMFMKKRSVEQSARLHAALHVCVYVRMCLFMPRLDVSTFFSSFLFEMRTPCFRECGLFAVGSHQASATYFICMRPR